MRSIKSIVVLLCLIGLFQACQKDEIGGGSSPIGGDWSINSEDVLSGGVGKDGIPSIDNPEFVTIDQVGNYLGDLDLVVGLRVGDEVKAYPHPILDWHEIVNDEVGGEPIALTYCPLTGTAMCWSRNLEGGTTTFGVSGLLFNTNLIPYDRATDSNWSQMLIEAVQGENKGEKPVSFPVIETTWGNWKKMYPNSKVLSTNTGGNRTYGGYPYGDYKTSNQVIFPLTNKDERLHLKERVHGLRINQQVKTYRFDSFEQGLRIINDEFEATKVVVAGNLQDNFIVSFNRQLADGTLLEMTLVEDAYPVIMQDESGTKWDVFGYATEGQYAGQQLVFETSLMGYWFTFGSFYPDPVIFEF